MTFSRIRTTVVRNTILGFLVAGLFFGCGQNDPTKTRITGNVTWLGTPIPDGDILFTPTSGGIPSAGKIVNGSFDMLVSFGEMRVEIIALKESGPVDPSMGMATKKNYIPTCYNDDSKLVVDITVDSKEFPFELIDEEA